MPNKEKTRIEETGVELSSSLDPQERMQRAVPDPDSPFRILVIGDFSARESRGMRGTEDIGFDRSPVRVDLDNLDELPGELGVEARLQLVDAGPFLDARIRTLEDFHPDRLFQEMPAFRSLNRTRAELQDPDTFDRAAAEVRSWKDLATSRDPDAAATPEGGAAKAGPGVRQAEAESEAEAEAETDSEALMREMVERSEAETGPSGRAVFDRFVQSVVEPHVAPSDAPDRGDLIRQTDQTIGSWMRAVLHHRRFQDLEAAWRGVAFLVRRLDSDSAVEVHILDITRDELAEDLRRVKDLSDSGIHKILVDQAVDAEDGQPWSLIAGLFTFDRTLEDIALLGRLAKVARAAGAPFLAAASPWIAGRASGKAGEDDAAEAALWAALRELPESSSIGLALPRFLLRLPYGDKTDPTEEFRFEEMEGTGSESSDGLLWGNPAIACASLIAEGWERGGWRFRPGATVRDIDGLPLYVSPASGTTDGTAICAEASLSDRAAEAILEEGLIPVLSMAGRDAIRVVRFQSIASPPQPLAGAWEWD